ncbi:MAG TPA: PfkB family carbohydrate kinase [Terriglobia bacterium]|nr:PfkB family carbohydrate kinase [Terriglobia bacterium]
MDKKQNRLARIVRQFRSRTIGVLGDYMFDELLRGEATRISPEAPVPVVLMGHSHAGEGFPGGAGNVAANIAALGGRPIPFGAIGWDESGKRLITLLEKRHIPCQTLLKERGRVTPRKVRIVAHQHQLLRLDFEEAREISPQATTTLARRMAQWIPRLDALIISDYRKGSVTTELCDRIIGLGRKKSLPIFVDPKPEHPQICRHATMVTPNLHEAEKMLGHAMRTRRELLAGGQRLLAGLGCANLLITRGSEGMTLFNHHGTPHDIPGVPRPVYDVTGAGDTVIAVLALAFSSGATMQEAAQLANMAGGRVVLKFGTAEITPCELMEAIVNGHATISAGEAE